MQLATGRSRPALAGEVTIVTGASSGIGAATAHELARRGATVVLAARRAAELAGQAQAIQKAGGEALAIPTDMTDEAAVMQLADRTIAAFGRVDVLVNNAGVNWRRPLATSPPHRITEVVEVNLLGAMLLTQAVVPGMLARRHGAVITVGSLSGRVAMEPLYSAGTGVSVSLVSPGNISTAMTSHLPAPMPGPELVAATIADLITHPRREVVIPRRHYAIAWLEQALPAVADRVYERRHWSPVRDEETVLWTS